jgi:preprotein translocase subunit SecA
MREETLERLDNSIAQLIMSSEAVPADTSVGEKIVSEFSTIIPFDENSQKDLASQLEQISDQGTRISMLRDIAHKVYEEREKQVTPEVMRQIENFVTLSVIDNLWMDHLDVVDNLREGIGLRAYGQKDPLVEYKNEAFRMFETLVAGIDDEIAHRIFKIQVAAPEHQHVHVTEKAAGEEIGADEVSKASKVEKKESHSAVGMERITNGAISSAATAVSPKKKPGRNDPCWCGSGKKYKKCHYPN